MRGLLLWFGFLSLCRAWYNRYDYAYEDENYMSYSEYEDKNSYGAEYRNEYYEENDENDDDSASDIHPFYAQSDVYDLFYKAIGDRLPRIVGDSDVLYRAIEESQSYANELFFGCGNYADGGDLARKFRNNPFTNTTLIPMLVDSEQDTMCFLIAVPLGSSMYPTLEKTLLYEPYLPILKILDETYDFMEHDLPYGNPNLDSLDLKVYYRPEAFQHITQSDEETYDYKVIYKTFKIALQQLSQYQVTSLNSFFWSDEKIVTFFDSYCERCKRASCKTVCERRKHWTTSKLYFHQLMDLEGGYKQNIYDPCAYETLFQSVEYTEDFIRVDLRGLGKVPADANRASCFANVVSMFASHPATHFIAVEPRPRLLSYQARSITQSGMVNADLTRQPYTLAGLRGDGQVVGIADTGLDVNNCYFYDSQGRVKPSLITSPYYDNKYRKVVQYNYNRCGDSNDEEAGHGTHVSGIAAGNVVGQDISTGGKYDGVAPNAKISFADLAASGGGLCIPSVTQLYPPGKAAGARVFSNSWGTYFSSGSGYYYGQDIDSWLHKNVDTTVLFAAGNVGNAQSITRESSAKNVISVGSSHTTLGSSNITYVAFYSSRGPVYDSRFKPDLVSPGHQLNSARASGGTSQTCDTITYTGTSMAAPAAAGVALMVRQYFADSRFWQAKCNPSYRSCRAFSPSGVLVKAVLTHSGAKMTLFNGGGSNDIPLYDPPDWAQGFGRIALYNALTLTGSFDLFVADGVNIAENSDVNYALQIKDSNRDLRVTLAWYDPPNVQGTTANALLNDLDLLVTGPDNKVYYPNGRRSADTVNNVERTVVNSPAVGSWKVKVYGKTLPSTGNQLFSLVITSHGTVGYV